jgi:biotin carboxylase
MKRKKILIVGAGILQVPAILKAIDLGLEVISIDSDRNAPGFRFAHKSFQISTLDIEQAVQCALQIKPDAVMTIASDMPVRTVAAIGKACGLIAISQETAINATNKGRMREQLKRHQVPIPEFYVTKSYDEFKDVIGNFKDHKYIVKPADNSGSRGVFLVDSSYDNKEIYEYSREYSRTGEVLVEEYMSGVEVSVEAITIKGNTHIIAITDKLTTGSPHFIEMGHSIPTVLSGEIQNKILDLTKKAVRAIGIDNGPSHTEIKVTDEGPKIVEIGARLGGDNITTHLVPFAKGINMVECCIKLALGEKVDLNSEYNMGAAIRYLNSHQGRINEISGIEIASNISGVKELMLLKKVGDVVTSIKSSTDRIGYIITQAITPVEAINICDEAISTLKIDII